MEFSVVASRMFALYGNQDYEAALKVVQDARGRFPDQDNDLTFWEACLLARGGQSDNALAVLAAGLERGQWWPPGWLADTDLDPVRTVPGWEELVQRCVDITAEKMKARPEPIVRGGASGGTLIAIQGARAIPQQVASTWEASTPQEWTVITPIGAEPAPTGGWGWPHSIDQSAESVLRDLEEMTLDRPVVLTGFSIGSAIACHIITTHALEVDGLIAVAPSSLADFSELRDAARQVRTLIIGGDQDPRHIQYEQLKAELESEPQITVEIIQGLGHANPPDLDQKVHAFLSQL